MIQPNLSLAADFARICLDAAVPVMTVYAFDFEATSKADRTPVTEADHLAEAIITARLAELMPDVPVLAEEAFADGARPVTERRFLLVDPVDGTREFINRTGEFTLNIALIEDAAPVAGCVYAPALQRLYIGGEMAYGGNLRPGSALDMSRLRPVRTRAPSVGRLAAVASRSHLDPESVAFLEARGVAETVNAGSSLKFCTVAEGAADLYPRFGPTMEWDTAAGHAVLAAAGGQVTRPDGSPFVYGKVEDGYRNGPFIAWGRLPADLA